MATTYSRHIVSYAPHAKTLPISLPAKAPAYAYPVSRAAMSPPEYSDTSTTYSSGRHSGGSYSSHSARSSSYAPSYSSRDYDSYRDSGIDVIDQLSDKMNQVFDPIKMDRALAKQAQTSGRMNAKERELQEMEALLQRRMKDLKVKHNEALEDVRETRRDIDYCQKKIVVMKSKAEKKRPEAYAKASRSRHAAQRFDV